VETAVYKMTGLPAAKLGLSDRGQVQAGYWADLVVFDLDKLTDRSTFQQPFLAPRGIEDVLVNGAFVIRAGNRPGRFPAGFSRTSPPHLTLHYKRLSRGPPRKSRYSLTDATQLHYYAFMENANYLLNRLKDQGHRLTRVRTFILDSLSKSDQPLSAADLAILLVKSKINANKTTVYRQLTFLKEQEMVREIQLEEKKKRYELMPENHHHHIVCLDCDKIEHVVLENDLDAEERNIFRDKDFKVVRHSLEFFGICSECR
jgi:Fe2+ or Zn2+ uptake regulation protein